MRIGGGHRGGGPSLAELCKRFAISRQSYYQQKQRDQLYQEQSQQLVMAVQQYRHHHPLMGCRKLLHLLRQDAPDLWSGGRDMFFKILRQHSLLVVRRRCGVRTTNSKHGFNRRQNLLQQMHVDRPNQVVISDITYLKTVSGYVYLCLVSDYYSRKIIGYDLSRSLAAEGAVGAMKMALSQISDTRGSVHHSDCGVQYCCHDYQGLLKQHKMVASMTEQNHCYENARAERINGILKYEYGLRACFRSLRHARAAVAEAIDLYNTRRPHSSLQYKTPAQVFAAA
jgi:putative transposase